MYVKWIIATGIIAFGVAVWVCSISKIEHTPTVAIPLQTELLGAPVDDIKHLSQPQALPATIPLRWSFLFDNDIDDQSKVNRIADLVAFPGEEERLFLSVIVLDANLDDTVRHELFMKLIQCDCHAVEKVVEAVVNNHAESDRMRSFCIQYLSHIIERKLIASSQLEPSLLAYSKSEFPFEVRRESLLALSRANRQLAFSEIDFILNTEDEMKFIDLFIRIFSETKSVEKIPWIRTHLDSPVEINQIAAISALAMLRDTECERKLELLKTSPRPRVVRAAITALAKLHEHSNKN